MQDKDISIISLNDVEKLIHTIRGQKVMLDADLAKIYGYETKAFNQQVKRNIERFPADMMFQLTDDEVKECSRSQIVTLNRTTGRGKNIKYNPYVFTEQGIYMLMTVLKGELAVKQSIILVRIFKEMKDYLSDNDLYDFEYQKYLDVYNAQTSPLIDYYTNKGILFNVVGNTRPEEVYAEISKKLDSMK